MTSGELERLPDLVTELLVAFDVTHIDIGEMSCAETTMIMQCSEVHVFSRIEFFYNLCAEGCVIKQPYSRQVVIQSSTSFAKINQPNRGTGEK